MPHNERYIGPNIRFGMPVAAGRMSSKLARPSPVS